MHQNQFLQLTAIALETVAEAGDRGIPSGYLYVGMQSVVDLDTYQRIVAALQRAALVTLRANVLTATDEGKRFALKLDGARAEAAEEKAVRSAK